MVMLIALMMRMRVLMLPRMLQLCTMMLCKLPLPERLLRQRLLGQGLRCDGGGELARIAWQAWKTTNES